jgi:hypothetical protein
MLPNSADRSLSPLPVLLALALAGLGACAGLGPTEPTEWVFPVWRDQTLGFIDQTGRLVIEPEFYGSLVPGDDIVPVLADLGEDQLWGFIDFTGEWVIQPRFGRVGPFSDGRAAFVDEDRLRGGYIDRSGEVVIDPVFEASRRFSEGLAAVKVQGRWGFIDPDGKAVIEPQYPHSRDFSEGLAMVEIPGGSIGYVDPAGEWVIPPHPKRAEGTAPTPVEGELVGQTVIQALLEGYNFSEGLAAVRTEDGTWGYIDAQGRWAIEPLFYGAGQFSEGLAPIRKGLRWGYVDRAGEVAVEPRFHAAKKFSLGLAPVKVPEEGWGFVNAEGEVVIEPVYESAEPFDHGLAAVQVGNRYGYIEPQGRWVWEPSR